MRRVSRSRGLPTSRDQRQRVRDLGWENGAEPTESRPHPTRSQLTKKVGGTPGSPQPDMPLNAWRFSNDQMLGVSSATKNLGEHPQRYRPDLRGETQSPPGPPKAPYAASGDGPSSPGPSPQFSTTRSVDGATRPFRRRVGSRRTTGMSRVSRVGANRGGIGIVSCSAQAWKPAGPHVRSAT
jgi:hypothetical protein